MSAGLARLAAVERRVKRRRYRLRPVVRAWLEGVGIGVGLALLAAIGHALTAVHP